MTKEQYAEQHANCLEMVEYYTQRDKEVRAAYIEANRPFDIGDRVTLPDYNTGNMVEGIITGHHLDAYLDVIPFVNKIEPNGATSHNTWWLYPNTVITKIETNGKEKSSGGDQ